jgi:hypothetical protein
MSKFPASSNLLQAQLRDIEIAKYYRQVMRLRHLVRQAERAGTKSDDGVPSSILFDNKAAAKHVEG